MVERFEERRDVRAGTDSTWSVLTDPAQVPAWLTIARRVEVEGPVDEGQVLHVTGGHLGVTRTVTARVDRFEPMSRYGWVVDDPLQLRFRYVLDDAAGHVTLAATVEADLTGLPRVATRLAVRSLRREFGRSLDLLSQLAARR